MLKLSYFNFFIFFVFFFCNITCTEEIDYSWPLVETKPVVNCFLTPDSTIKIFLHKTNKIGSINFENINDAEVFLINNADTAKACYDKRGYYFINTLPKAMTSYKIQVNEKGIPDYIYAFDTLPAVTPILSSKFIYPYEYVIGEFISGDIAGGYIEFADNIHTRNFYEFAIYSIKEIVKFNDITNNYDSIGFYYKVSNASSDDYFIEAEGLSKYKSRTVLFSDKLINGQKVRLNFKNFGFGKIYVLRSVSRDYYLYKKSLIINLYNNQIHNIDQFSDISNYSIIGNPVEVYSNIEGGLGIFAGYSSHTIKVWYNYNDSVYYEH